jgi:uncharacterized protein (DUF488 family)
MSKLPPPQEAHWPEGAVFTVGHSTLAIERFIALLQAYGIERLADIRKMPRSRHSPQRFSQYRMAQRGLSRLRRLYAKRGVSGRA